MAQPEPAGRNRRRHPRWTVPDDGAHRIELWWPSRRGLAFEMPVHDLSPSGLSFRMDQELPGLEVCSQLRTVSIQLGAVSFKADLVVIHLTARPGRPTICGTLVYPKTDADLIALKGWLASHEPA